MHVGVFVVLVFVCEHTVDAVLAEHLVEEQLLVGRLADNVGAPFVDTSVDVLTTYRAGIGVRVSLVLVEAVGVYALPLEPGCELHVEVEVAVELVVGRSGLVASLKVIEVVVLLRVHPAAVTVRNEIAVFIVGGVPGKHGVHRRYGVLTVGLIAARSVYGRTDGEPACRLVVCGGAETVLLEVVALHGTGLIVVAEREV